MTKEEAGKALIEVTCKLEILRTAADEFTRVESGPNDMEEAMRTIGRYYIFTDGAEIMLKEAVATLQEIEAAT